MNAATEKEKIADTDNYFFLAARVWNSQAGDCTAIEDPRDIYKIFRWLCRC